MSGASSIVKALGGGRSEYADDVEGTRAMVQELYDKGMLRFEFYDDTTEAPEKRLPVAANLRDDMPWQAPKTTHVVPRKNDAVSWQAPKTTRVEPRKNDAVSWRPRRQTSWSPKKRETADSTAIVYV